MAKKEGPPAIEEANKELLADADSASGKNVRKKIEVTGLSAKQIQEKYGVSRATAFRGEKRGWIFLNYHQREIEIDNEWAASHTTELRESAKSGAYAAMTMLNQTKANLTTFQLEDLISVAFQRLLELSGHPDREVKAWRVQVAINAVAGFLKTQLITPDKFIDDFSEVEDL